VTLGFRDDVGMERPEVDESKELHLQLRELRDTLYAQFGRRDLADKDFASKVGFSTSMVSRAWRAEHGRRPNAVVSMGIAWSLGLSTAYTALVLVRDQLQRERERSKHGASTAERKLVDAILGDLGAAVRSLNPFGSSHRNRRLAIRALRVASGVPRNRIPRRIRSFERGDGLVPSDADLSDWSRQLDPAASDRLRELATSLGEVHPISQSLERGDGRAVPLGHTLERILVVPPDTGSRDRAVWRFSDRQPALRWYCPPGAGHILLEGSPTIFGAITCEVLTATVNRASPDPAPSARSLVRCVGARHTGYEFAVITHGALLLTVSDTPFDNESPTATPLFEGRAGVVFHRVCRAGDVVGFDSGRYHRCEFLATYNRCVSFNISRAVLLHGKVGADR